MVHMEAAEEPQKMWKKQECKKRHLLWETARVI